MNEIKIFENPQFGEIRTMTDEQNAPLFCALDLCVALGYANSRDAITRHVDEEDVVKRDTPTRGGTQLMAYVNESGLYSLIFGSRLETARMFKRWVTSEVLPAIRRTGAYAMLADRRTVTPALPPARVGNRQLGVRARVHLIEALCRNLRLDADARLTMYKALADEYGVTIPGIELKGKTAPAEGGTD